MHLFFDLDGTLTDSWPGICRCINHALTALGRPAVPEPEIRGMVGLPLTTIFSALCSSDDDRLVDRAIAAYRDRFDAIGMFENQLFPGIPEALRRLRESGHRLRIVTAKPRIPALRIVQHFGIDALVEAVHGPELDARGSRKEDLVREALTAAGIDGGGAIMIGDRAEDIRAGRAHGAHAVGAGWGYGSGAELHAAAPDFVAETIADLVEWIEAQAGSLHPGAPSARHTHGA